MHINLIATELGYFGYFEDVVSIETQEREISEVLTWCHETFGPSTTEGWGYDIERVGESSWHQAMAFDPATGYISSSGRKTYDATSGPEMAIAITNLTDAELVLFKLKFPPH